MFAAFAQFFAMFATLFTAADKAANGICHLASFAEEAAEEVTLTARLERQAKIRDLKQQLGLTDESVVSTQ